MSHGIHGAKGSDGKVGSQVKSTLSYEHDRERLFGMLDDLLWDDMDALFQLDDYTRNRRNRPDKRVTNLLMEKGLLAEDGTLPDATNEAMYEMRTGCSPFWLKDEDNSKIVDFAEYLKRKKEKQNE